MIVPIHKYNLLINVMFDGHCSYTRYILSENVYSCYYSVSRNFDSEIVTKLIAIASYNINIQYTY